ncbi:MAG TPA: ATP-binding cassette domain-containing protein, partial [Gemmatirosa sp.]
MDLRRLTVGDAGVTIGRDAAVAQIVIAHPAVSRAHAAIRRVNGALVVEDLGSTNGTFVEGRRIAKPTALRAGASLEIGSAVYVVDANGLTPLTPTSGARLAIDAVSLAVGARGHERTLLSDVTVGLDGAGLLCVLGPSGCGKSTLLKLVAGRLAPTRGRVLVDDVDVHGSYDSVKHRLGYVPQHEALRDELTVAEMLRYTARLRLPPDLARSETDDIIVGLAERTGLAERLGTRIGALSGGQRRRLGLINEFVGRPSLALLDEVTSGLDEEAAHGLMQLIKEFVGDGMTVVCVTHTVAAVEPYADTCLILATGGYPAFFGSPADAPRFFGVASLADVYARLHQRPSA